MPITKTKQHERGMISGRTLAKSKTSSVTRRNKRHSKVDAGLSAVMEAIAQQVARLDRAWKALDARTARMADRL